MRYRCSLLLAIGCSLIAYCSLRSSPTLAEISWLPEWLGAWADKHGELRTGVPFFIVSSYIALESWYGFRASRALPPLMWALAVYGLLCVLGLTELIQIWLPQRTASWADIAWGSAGALAGGWPLLLRSASASASET